MILKNERMRIEISPQGAELMHIFDLKNNAELLWNGDPVYWKRRSPVLFPNVGKTHGNVMKINGKTVSTCQHGFARDMEFALEESGGDHAAYLLASSEETLKRYPCPFELRIIYRICKNALKVIWRVKNTGDGNMPFTIGGHPAFCFGENETKTDYKLFFPGMTGLSCIALDLSSGTAMPECAREIALQEGCLALSDDLFANDALILDDSQVKEVWLCRKNGGKRIGMKCAVFPNFGVWSVQGAPFVCLEPWQGRCDNRGFDGEFGEKAGAITLAPGQEFETGYEILLPD